MSKVLNVNFNVEFKQFLDCWLVVVLLLLLLSVIPLLELEMCTCK